MTKQSICFKCGCRMGVSRIGVEVFEPEYPKITRADVEKCPRCGVEVITRWADQPKFLTRTKAEMVSADPKVFIVQNP